MPSQARRGWATRGQLQGQPALGTCSHFQQRGTSAGLAELRFPGRLEHGRGLDVPSVRAQRLPSCGSCNREDLVSSVPGSCLSPSARHLLGGISRSPTLSWLTPGSVALTTPACYRAPGRRAVGEQLVEAPRTGTAWKGGSARQKQVPGRRSLVGCGRLPLS